MIKRNLFEKLLISLLAAYASMLMPVYAQTGASNYHSDKPYYTASWQQDRPASMKVARHTGEHSAIVQISSAEELEKLGKQALLTPVNDEWKLSPSASGLKNKKARERFFILSSNNLTDLLAVLHKMGAVTIHHTDSLSSSVLIRCLAETVYTQLLPLKEVIFIDEKVAPKAEIGIIGYNRSFHGLSAVDYAIPGANGKNIVVGIKEQRMEAADLDLHRRVLPSSIASNAITNHATVISSIIGGAGNSFYDGRGIANACTFFPSSFDNLFADNAGILNTNKVTVQNHSYGTVIQQFYGAEAVSYDALVWGNKNIVPVFSAGNQGTGAATTGNYANIPGYANLTGNFKMAKNCITVGAIDNKNNIPAESSSGPLYDGRLAPQLIALGPNGSSDAAAVVSGTAAVLQQVYADSNSQVLPPASLIKAVLFTSADDLHRSGIDYKTGYGLLNSFEAIKTVQQKRYDGGSLTQGQQWIKNITVPPGTAQLKVTLSWTDSAAQVNNSKALINDLDLEITEVNSGTIYRPWVLSTFAHADSLAKVATRKKDTLNTTEQVSIALPPAGLYQVKVTGTNIANTQVAFHIAYSTDTLNTFRFISPQHTSDINRDENPFADIRWRTYVADTNHTGNLYISYNGGANWQLVKAAHKIYTNYYQWGVKDTASRAIFRMETSFGDFLSNEFVLSKVTNPVIDFLCDDSFALSWDRHMYASSYKIYTLTDSPYLKHIRTVTDTFAVMNRALYTGNVYAVEPELTNNIPAARSIAIDITQQGVKCFYKTFYYVLLDENRLELRLELSAPAYADSIFFEQVTAGGGLLKSAGTLKTNMASLYTQLVNDIPQGTTYWRAKIKLKSGAFVYTEIIPVISSGSRQILFYPNPAVRSTPLSWIIRQGTPSSSRLQLFDGTGRLVADFAELPVAINLTHLPAGFFIYKLLSRDGLVLETGKLILL